MLSKSLVKSYQIHNKILVTRLSVEKHSGKRSLLLPRKFYIEYLVVLSSCLAKTGARLHLQSEHPAEELPGPSLSMFMVIPPRGNRNYLYTRIVLRL